MGFTTKSGLLLFLLVLVCFFAAAKFAVNDKAIEISQAETDYSGTAKVATNDEAEQVSQTDAKNILKKLLTARPDLEFSILGMSPIPGVYEVQVKNGPLLFVYESGEYLFQGDLLQIKANEIISTMEVRQASERQQLFAQRSTEDMIIFKPEGEIKAVMNVFTDVDCGYCRKFHQEVPQLNAMGIEIRYLAYPRAGIPSGSYDKIAKAWCAEDQQDILTKVKSGQRVDVEVCDNNPIAEHYAFGSSIGVTGTPAIILMDGTLIPGYQPADNFAKLLGIAPK
ncbi:MAG: DsbC family protein [Porticoccaceae bacterium]